MGKSKPQYSLLDGSHAMTKLKDHLVARHMTICAAKRISPWDFVVVLANVQAEILAIQKDMPADAAEERFDALRKTMTIAYGESKAGNPTPVGPIFEA